MDGGGGAQATSTKLWVYFAPTLCGKQSASAGSRRRATSHSGRAVPLHIRPSSRRMYPVGHLHWYEPSTLTQRKAHSSGLRAHSLMSARGRETVRYCHRSLLVPAWNSVSFLLLLPHDSTTVLLCPLKTCFFFSPDFLKGHTGVLRAPAVPSQVIMEPGSKPSSQAHSKPPTTLVQVPLPQGFPTSHSLVSAGARGKKTFHIGAGGQRDSPRKGGRLLAFTSDATDVQIVSHGAFTPERAVCVDALAVDARVVDALVNIWGVGGQSRERKTTKK